MRENIIVGTGTNRRRILEAERESEETPWRLATRDLIVEGNDLQAIRKAAKAAFELVLLETNKPLPEGFTEQFPELNISQRFTEQDMKFRNFLETDCTAYHAARYDASGSGPKQADAKQEKDRLFSKIVKDVAVHLSLATNSDIVGQIVEATLAKTAPKGFALARETVLDFWRAIAMQLAEDAGRAARADF